MLAMVLDANATRLRAERRPLPEPGPGEVRLRVEACAVCRTDLHVMDGDLKPTCRPIVPGHEIVGMLDAQGAGVASPAIGQRVGIGWLGHSCGVCPYCRSERENLCDAPAFTGYSRDGGFATHVVAEAGFTFPLSASDDPVKAAPLMCAGLIGWRCLKAAGGGKRLGLYGFGAAAHLVAQVARWQERSVYAFAKPGDDAAKDLARSLGVDWAGGSDERPPEPLDAAIIFAPVGELVPAALRALRKGGRVVCGGIHMSDIPRFPYAILWEEREVVSVANLTRRDAREFIALASLAKVEARTQTYPLLKANQALADLRAGRVSGAAVLVPPSNSMLGA
ncbi:zinc-dependent alcohol dehydrogenase family protein [Aureimonas sp. AU4]|uniref:zinc-dependent alcohol dehydrogenase family protein n=1 Tax=Aureimonas sp. AU4 TaxID=1638163 RepID=UPI0012E3C736|nr:zinc-dependent alcohol dehydrogenase family protein [Aureimonas sp. AU4]